MPVASWVPRAGAASSGLVEPQFDKDEFGGCVICCCLLLVAALKLWYSDGALLISERWRHGSAICVLARASSAKSLGEAVRGCPHKVRLLRVLFHHYLIIELGEIIMIPKQQAAGQGAPTRRPESPSQGVLWSANPVTLGGCLNEFRWRYSGYLRVVTLGLVLVPASAFSRWCHRLTIGAPSGISAIVRPVI